jgi:KDO2-lipid IV(A) lauroyltransferase
VSFLFRLLSHLPLSILHNLGAVLGVLTYFISPTYRRHLQENTALAGDWAVAVRLAAAIETGKGLLELPFLWLRPQAEVIRQVVRVSGWQHVEAAVRDGQGILMLTPHLGGFEIIAQYCSAQRPFTALYRAPRQRWLQPLMEQGRGAHVRLAPADLGGVRLLMKALRRKETVGILPDQVPGNGEGIWSPFFGKPAYTMTLAARLAQSAGAVLLIRAERLPYGAGYHLIVEPLGEPLAESLEARVAQINAALERMIRACPAQYLWGYNRYKGSADAPLAQPEKEAS